MNVMVLRDQELLPGELESLGERWHFSGRDFIVVATIGPKSLGERLEHLSGRDVLRVKVQKRVRTKGKYRWVERRINLPADFPDVPEVLVLAPGELQALETRDQEFTPLEKPDWTEVAAMLDLLMPEDKDIRVVGDYVIIRLERMIRLLGAVGKHVELSEIPWWCLRKRARDQMSKITPFGKTEAQVAH